MTRRQAELEFRKALLAIRRQARRAARGEIATWRAALGAVARSWPAGSATALLGARRASQLLREVNVLLVQIELALQHSAARAIAQVARTIRDEYSTVHARLLETQGLPSGGVVARFRVIPQRVNERLVTLYGRNETLAAITGRNIAAARSSIEAYVTAATGRTPDRVAVQSIGRILQGRLPIDIAGLEPKVITPARGLVHRGIRIIGTETFHAMREGTAEGSAQSPLILAGRWTLSDRHHELPSSPDECDQVAAGGRIIDGKPGWYEPEEWPVAPHPRCECYQGDTRFIDPAEWAAAVQGL